MSLTPYGDAFESLWKIKVVLIFFSFQGMSVYVNGQIGILRFIGRVEFSDGIWLGVDLRKQSMYEKGGGF